MKIIAPSLPTIFSDATKITIQEDLERSSESIFLLKLENSTFGDRVLANFLILAGEFYSNGEIMAWWEREFFRGGVNSDLIN